MKTINFSILLLLISSNAWSDNLFCEAHFYGNRPITNATSSMKKPHEGRHVLTYEILRGDCDDGYAFEVEGYGPGLSYHAENLVISCPFVTNFRGSYAGLKVHAGLVVGFDTATFVGPGVCFILGIGPSFGAGASIGLLRIKHKNDVEELQPDSSRFEERNLEIPEERKAE
jgi:hypothetical protein